MALCYSVFSFTCTDNILLLQPFCTKAQFLSGKAKVDLIEKVAGMFDILHVPLNKLQSGRMIYFKYIFLLLLMMKAFFSANVNGLCLTFLSKL